MAEMIGKFPPADDFVERWHNDHENETPLHEYMGLTWEQYKVWVENPKDAWVIMESPEGVFNTRTVSIRHIDSGWVAQSWGNGNDLIDFLKGLIETKIAEETWEQIPRERIEATVKLFDDEGRYRAGHSVRFGDTLVIDNMRVRVGMTHPARRF